MTLHFDSFEARDKLRGKSFRDPCKFIAGVFLAFALQLSFFLPELSAATPPKFIIGYAAMSARVVPLWLAEEQGIFAKYGVDSEPVFIRGAPILVAGLASGDIHVGSTGGSATLAAIAGGQDLKIMAAFSSRNTFDLVTKPHIKRARRVARQTIRRHQHRRHRLDGHHALARTFRSR